MFKFLAKHLINDSEDALFFKLRKKRAEKIKSLIAKCYSEHKAVSIIDIGGTKTYWRIIPLSFLLEHNVHITIVNIPSSTPLPEDDKVFTFREGDGCNLSEFGNNSFHIAHSNSVIEHVGNWENKVFFAKEQQRVARILYMQTPNYWFLIEPHYVTPFFHWLPKALRIKLLLHFSLGLKQKLQTYEEARVRIEHCDLLSKREILSLFPKERFALYKEKFLFFTKSWITITR